MKRITYCKQTSSTWYTIIASAASVWISSENYEEQSRDGRKRRTTYLEESYLNIDYIILYIGKKAINLDNNIYSDRVIHD